MFAQLPAILLAICSMLLFTYREQNRVKRYNDDIAALRDAVVKQQHLISALQIQVEIDEVDWSTLYEDEASSSFYVPHYNGFKMVQVDLRLPYDELPVRLWETKKNHPILSKLKDKSTTTIEEKASARNLLMPWNRVGSGR